MCHLKRAGGTNGCTCAEPAPRSELAASTLIYLTPVVGVTFGALFLGESVHWNEPVGGLIVILGIVASQGLLEKFRKPAVASAA